MLLVFAQGRGEAVRGTKLHDAARKHVQGKVLDSAELSALRDAAAAQAAAEKAAQEQRQQEEKQETAERVRAVLSRAAKRLELARNLVKRRLNEREAELQLRSGLSEIDRAVAKLQSVARARFKFKRLVPVVE